MTAVTPSFSHFHPNPSNTKQLLRNPTHFHFFVRFEFLLDFPFKIGKTKFLHHPPNNTSSTNGFFPVLPTFTIATILFTFTVFPLFSPSFEEEKYQSSTGTLLLFLQLGSVVGTPWFFYKTMYSNSKFTGPTWNTLDSNFPYLIVKFYPRNSFQESPEKNFHRWENFLHRAALKVGAIPVIFTKWKFN